MAERAGENYFLLQMLTSLLRSRVLAAIFIASLGTNTLLRADSFDLPSKDSPDAAWWRDSMKTHDERIEWWREARFGMFVHWGVYSSLGNEYKGRKGGGYAEHIQRVLKIPIPEYRAEVAGHFNPTNFNADEWIRTARDAGMGYFIITSKHHDGFAMWPTKVNDYNVMDATPWHHDPMADLRAACKKYGVKFGFYYSHAFDWGNSNAPGNDWDYNNPGGDKLIGGKNWWETKPEFMASARKYVDEKAIPQIRELIKNYDPDIFWFDTPSKLPPSENFRIMKAVREASPRVVINGRLVHGWGDYDSTADRPAEFSPHDGDWEGIPTTNESYGWNKFDHSQKPPSHFIQLLAKAAARGGNILMNVGPMGTGEMDPQDVAILKGIGEWWRVNGESIRGTTRTPLPVQTWGESTIHAWSKNLGSGATIYLHVFNWPANGQLVVGGLKSTNLGIAYLLAEDYAAHNGGVLAPRKWTRLNSSDISISVPTNAPDKADSVVILNVEGGNIEADNHRLLQPDFGGDTLRVFDGELHGKGLKFGPGKVRDAYAMDWTKPDEFISWPARINEPATYDVELTYDAEANSAGGTFSISFGSQTLNGVIKSGTIQTTQVGRVKLQPGSFEIKLAAGEIKGSELMRPRTLTLKRADF
jgi:alpha-L-fucosidase